MMIVYEAESKVKFVAIDPNKLIGRSIFCEKGIPECPIMFTINDRFGSHTAKANTVMLIVREKNTYRGFRNTFCRAYTNMITFLAEPDQ